MYHYAYRNLIQVGMIVGGMTYGITALEHQVEAGKQTVVPILIVGSGVAGLTAAEYAARSHVPTVFFTGEQPGGQLVDAAYVENIPGIPLQPGSSIIERLEEQAITFGAQKIEDSVVEIVPVNLKLSTKQTNAFLVRTTLGHELYALTIIVATGSSPRKLGIPGEQDYWGRGVHTCPRCDALFYKDHDVAIVGGGDTAVEYAELLAAYARHVTILVRSPVMRAAARVKARLIDYDNVTVLYHQRVTAALGDNGKMTGLALEDVVTGEQSTLPVTGLFLAIGHEPAVDLVRSLVELESTDHIHLTQRNQETSMPSLFSAGDVDDAVYRQAVVAAAEGAMAALDAVNDLHERGVTEHFIRHLRSMNLLFDYSKVKI